VRHDFTQSNGVETIMGFNNEKVKLAIKFLRWHGKTHTHTQDHESAKQNAHNKQHSAMKRYLLITQL
jgi:hypothetical protein